MKLMSNSKISMGSKLRDLEPKDQVSVLTTPLVTPYREMPRKSSQLALAYTDYKQNQILKSQHNFKVEQPTFIS